MADFLGCALVKLNVVLNQSRIGICMAYLRDEKESFEIDYPVEEIWATIPQVIKTLEWTIEERDEQLHKLKLKTKPGFFAYPSLLFIEIVLVNEKTSKMIVKAETPVTTITAIADFGRTRDRLEQFVETLAREMDKKNSPKQASQPKI